MTSRQIVMLTPLDINDLIPEKAKEFFKIFEKAGHNLNDYCEFEQANDGSDNVSSFYFGECTYRVTCLYVFETETDDSECQDITAKLKKFDVTEYLTKDCIGKYIEQLAEIAVQDERDDRADAEAEEMTARRECDEDMRREVKGRESDKSEF